MDSSGSEHEVRNSTLNLRGSITGRKLNHCIPILYQVFDECTIYDQQLTDCVQIHLNDPQLFPLHMELTLRAGYCVKLCTQLAKVICPYNYYNLFYLFVLTHKRKRTLRRKDEILHVLELRHSMEIRKSTMHLRVTLNTRGLEVQRNDVRGNDGRGETKQTSYVTTA